MAAKVAGLVMLDPKMAKNVVDVTNILKEGLGDPFFTGTHQNGSYQWGARMPKLDEVAILETFKEDEGGETVGDAVNIGELEGKVLDKLEKTGIHDELDVRLCTATLHLVDSKLKDG